jgi:chemotaxis protein MotB
MPAPVTPTIIIIKKKGGHGGHHGGAWKVAYADFVTAMMALFIVLWLLSSSADVQQAVSGYFRDPKGFGKQLGTNVGGQGETLTVTKTNLNQLKEKLEAAIHQTPQLDKIKNHVKMTITGDGLRIEMMESDKGTFFENGEAVPTSAGTALLVEIAHQFSSMPNSLLIEGHTDAKAFDSTKYSNWELSADRANASRRIMQENGLRPNQVSQVRGFADQQLRLPAKPDDPSNRRITIIVQYLQVLAPPDPAKGKPGAEGGEEKEEKKVHH